MKKYVVGSRLLCLENQHDTDYIVIVPEDFERNEKSALEDANGIENVNIFYKSEKYLNQFMNLEVEFSNRALMNLITIYQYDIDIIRQDFPYEYHVLDKRDKIINMLNYIVDTESCGFHKRVNYNNGHLPKHIYHIAYLTFIMKNNSIELTSEQREIIQKLHDRVMPKDYLDELKSIIKSL